MSAGSWALQWWVCGAGFTVQKVAGLRSVADFVWLALVDPIPGWMSESNAQYVIFKKPLYLFQSGFDILFFPFHSVTYIYNKKYHS